MNTRAEVQEFLEQKRVAIAGISRDPNAFSARVFEELTAKGYHLIPVNPNAATIAGRPCFPTLSSVPDHVEALLLFTPPSVTEAIVREAIDLGIRHLWIQQGAESDAALRLCAENNLRAVSRQCILMFAKPVGSLHAVHRWFRRIAGRMPK